MKYCTNCKQAVKPVKREWSWVAFFLFLGILYPIYRLFVSSNRCPICKCKSLISMKKAKKIESMSA